MMIFGYSAYDFLRDQGSLISGFLALTAGLLAFGAGREQVAAAERQNRASADSERKANLREDLIATRMMSAVLLASKANFDTVKPKGIPAREVRSRALPLPLLEVQGVLSQMPRNFVEDYCSLHMSIRRFRDYRDLANPALDVEIGEISARAERLLTAAALSAQAIETELAALATAPRHRKPRTFSFFVPLRAMPIRLRAQHVEAPRFERRP